MVSRNIPGAFSAFTLPCLAGTQTEEHMCRLSAYVCAIVIDPITVNRFNNHQAIYLLDLTWPETESQLSQLGRDVGGRWRRTIVSHLLRYRFVLRFILYRLRSPFHGHGLRLHSGMVNKLTSVRRFCQEVR